MHDPQIYLEFWREFFQTKYKSFELKVTANIYASDWRRCASCALKLEKRMMHNEVCGPASAHLAVLGLNFYCEIINAKWKNAEEIFERIQEMVEEENKSVVELQNV